MTAISASSRLTKGMGWLEATDTRGGSLEIFESSHTDDCREYQASCIDVVIQQAEHSMESNQAQRCKENSTLYVTAVFLDKIVMPLSLSRSLESIMRSCIFWLSLKMFDCRSMASTSVVLPWSTWAMIAMFLIFWATGSFGSMAKAAGTLSGAAQHQVKSEHP